MRKTVVLSIVLLVLLAACAPKVAPASAPAPAQATLSQSGTPTSNILPARQDQGEPSTSQDAAWTKVVEAAKKEGRLTIYSYNFVGDVGLAVSQAFRERYRIQVDIITGRGAAFIERLKTEKRMGSILADMTDNSPTNAKNMKEQGFTISVADELPSLREKDVWLADILATDPQDRHLISFNFSTYSSFVNTNLVKPGEEPTVWKDLLDPKWKGKMTVADPTTGAGLLNTFVPLMREKVVDEEFLKGLYKQDIRFALSAPDAAGIISRAERSLVITATSSEFGSFVSQGAPIRAVALSDGTVLTAIVVAAYGGAPHPNAAKVFINWLISQEGQAVYSKAASVTSARKDVPSSLPKAGQVTPKRPIIVTNVDSDTAAKLFQQQYLNKLWGR